MSRDKQIEEMARFLWKCTLIPSEELCSDSSPYMPNICIYRREIGMKLSQLIHAMDRYDTIIVNAYDRRLPTNKQRIYKGEVRGIHRDNPINKCHVKFVAAVQDELLVEIAVDERRERNDTRTSKVSP